MGHLKLLPSFYTLWMISTLLNWVIFSEKSMCAYVWQPSTQCFTANLSTLRYCMLSRIILIFPILAVGRGVNIVFTKGPRKLDAAIGSIYFLTRPHPSTDDRESAAPWRRWTSPRERRGNYHPRHGAAAHVSCCRAGVLQMLA